MWGCWQSWVSSACHLFATVSIVKYFTKDMKLLVCRVCYDQTSLKEQWSKV